MSNSLSSRPGQWRRITSRVLGFLGGALVLFGLLLPTRVFFSLPASADTIRRHFESWTWGSGSILAAGLLAMAWPWFSSRRGWMTLFSLAGLAGALYGWFSHWQDVVAYNNLHLQFRFGWTMHLNVIGTSWPVLSLGFLVTFIASFFVPPLTPSGTVSAFMYSMTAPDKSCPNCGRLLPAHFSFCQDCKTWLA